MSPEHCSPTKYARVSRCSHGNVVMLFCPSFTQSERFLQTDQLIIRLQVVVVINFIRMLMRNVFENVFKSQLQLFGGQRSSAYSVQHFTSPLHDDRRATTPRQQGNLPLTHLQCSQLTWSSVTSSHAADSVTFAERVRNSKSRPWSMIHRNCDRCCQTQCRTVPSSTGFSKHR